MSHIRPRTMWMATALAIASATALLPAGPALATVGTPAAAGEHTYTVRLTIGDEADSRACSGVLVDASWVLSAASCFAKTPGAAVVAGRPALPATAKIGAGTVTFDVINIVPHSSRDVVLAKLSKPVTSSITPIKIAAAQPATGADVTAAGFGRTKTAWVQSKVHTAKFAVASADATTLALTAKGTDAICQGDAGGPLVNSKGELAGISTRSWQGGCLGTPATETRTNAVAARADNLGSWVEKTTFYPQGDFTGDGIADLAAIWSNGSLHLYRGDKTKGLAGTETELIGGTSWGSTKQLVKGDFTGDRIADLISVWNDGTMHLYKGKSDGTIEPQKPVTMGGNTWGTLKQITAGDFDGDGIDDLATIWADGTMHLYRSNGAGDLYAGTTVTLGGNTWGTIRLLPGGDFDGDGIADLMAVWNDGTMHYYKGKGNGQILDGAPVVMGGNTWKTVPHMTAGDHDGDGIADIMVIWADGSLHLYKGNGKGDFLDGTDMAGGTSWKTMLQLA